MINDDPYISPEELTKANNLHDHAHPDFLRQPGFVVPSWKDGMFARKGPLTDRKIAQYERKGFYSQEYRDARKVHQQKRNKRREGNFDITSEGKMIYRPL